MELEQQNIETAVKVEFSETSNEEYELQENNISTVSSDTPVNESEEDISETPDDPVNESEEDISDPSDDPVNESEKETSETPDDPVNESEEDISDPSDDPVNESEEETSETPDDPVNESEEDISDPSDDPISESEEDISDPSDDPISESEKETSETPDTPVNESEEDISDPSDDPINESEEDISDPSDDPISESEEETTAKNAVVFPKQGAIAQWSQTMRMVHQNTNGNYLFLILCTVGFLLGMGYTQTQEPELSAIAGMEELSTLPELPQPESISIKAVGDMVPGINFPVNKVHPQPEKLFEAVTPLLQDVDIVFGNLETTLTNYTVSSKGLGGGLVFAFRTPPDYNKLLKNVGFDVLSVANNHSFDFGEQGFADTIKSVEDAGMEAVGEKGEIAYSEIEGVKIAWIAFSVYKEHNSILQIEESARLVEEAQENADFVVLSIHGGAEGSHATSTPNKQEMFYGEKRGNLVKFSRTMIDRGADLVLGHGPHVPRGLELYKNKLIAYSLGNFMGYKAFRTFGHLGDSLVLEVEVNPQGDFISGKIHPLRLNKDGIPFPTNSKATIELMDQLSQTDFPESPLQINPDGTISKKVRSLREF